MWKFDEKNAVFLTFFFSVWTVLCACFTGTEEKTVYLIITMREG